jgi:hypothetical protein
MAQLSYWPGTKQQMQLYNRCLLTLMGTTWFSEFSPRLSRRIVCSVLLAPRPDAPVHVPDHMSGSVDCRSVLFALAPPLVQSIALLSPGSLHATKGCLSRARNAGEDIKLDPWTTSHRSTSFSGCNNNERPDYTATENRSLLKRAHEHIPCLEYSGLVCG